MINSSLIQLQMSSEKNICIFGLTPYTGHMGAVRDISEVIFVVNTVNDRTPPAPFHLHGSDEGILCYGYMEHTSDL